MGSFRQPPGGVGVMPYDALGDIDTGIAPWGGAAISSFYTGFQSGGLGYAATQARIPPLALTEQEGAEPIFHDLATRDFSMPLREMTEAETNKRGYVLANDPELFKRMFPTIPHERGMTIERALAIKDEQDAQAVRDQYMKDRPITSFVGQLAGSVPTPENFIPILGELGAGIKAGYGIKLGISAARASGEAVIGTSIFDIATLEGRAALGQDTSWKAMAMDIGFSALIGAGFGTVGGLFQTPSPSAASPFNLADSPENRAKANVIMNDAIGSFLNSPNNTVQLGPQSYRYILDTTQSVPEASISFTWDNVRIEDAPKVQEFADKNLLNDPEIALVLKGTQVTDKHGKPVVVYTGSMVPTERMFRPDLDSLNTGIGPMDNYGSSVWFSTNPNHAQGFIDYLGTHPDIQNIDFPIDIKQWKGREQGTRAVKINDEYFIGGVHAEALDKAVAYYGPDSQVIRDFENLPEEKQLEAMGHLDKDGFHPGETAIAGKEEISEYIEAQREWLKKQGQLVEKTETGAYSYGIVPPRIEGALVDIKKPMEISAKDFADNKTRMDRVFEARDAKDKNGNPLYDGVVARNIEINGEKGDVYSTWNSESILTMRDTTARKIREGQERKTAEYQNASNLAQTNGYSYSTPKYSEYKNIQGADLTPVVNIDALAKEADILKYSEGVVKAAGGDLKANITPQDEKFKAFSANRELTKETLKAIEEADTFIKKASFVEQVMQLAVGCKDG